MKISKKTLEIIEIEQKCIGCKACMKGCPMLDKFCESPKDLLKGLLDTEVYEYKMPYSCMLCGYCTKVCPKGVDLKSLFLELRRDCVQETKGKLPKELNAKSIEMHQKFSFSKIFTSDIQGLQSDTIFFPGCALISYSPELVQKTFNYLQLKSPGIGYYNKCCGKPTKFMGFEVEFDQYYSDLEREFKNKGVRRIITGCQNCYKTIGENSPDIEVISLWEFISDNGIPENKLNIGIKIKAEFTLHDPCPTRNEDGIHEAVRDIVEKMGLKIREMKYNRGRTLCCGSGGMVPLTQNAIGRAHMNRRASEASTDYIITYCQECVESMRRGGKYSYHILDLLFNDNFEEILQESHSTLTRWSNRYKGKKIKVKTNKEKEATS